MGNCGVPSPLAACSGEPVAPNSRSTRVTTRSARASARRVQRPGFHEVGVKPLHGPVTTALAQKPPRLGQSRRLDHGFLLEDATVTADERDLGRGQLPGERDGTLRSVRTDVDHDVIQLRQSLLEFPPEDADLVTSLPRLQFHTGAVARGSLQNQGASVRRTVVPTARKTITYTVVGDECNILHVDSFRSLIKTYVLHVRYQPYLVIRSCFLLDYVCE